MRGITISTSSQASAPQPLVSNNVILNCLVGIEIYSGSPIIQDNLIVNNTGGLSGGEGGIRVNYQGTDPTIQDNTIAYNSVGLDLLSSPSPQSVKTIFLATVNIIFILTLKTQLLTILMP